MHKKVRKAVIPAAGLGTRFLPATKALPKEMLPVVDKPAIQYVVEEAVASGLEDVLLVVGRNKFSIQDHFDAVPELQATLQKKGDEKRLSTILASNELANTFYVRQGEPLGLGHAVLKSQAHVGDESFAVLLGDDLIDVSNPLLPQLIAEHDSRGATVIALMEVDPSHIHLYGVASVEPTENPDVVRVLDLVEKPDAANAPSNLAVIGRYVLRPSIYEVLERTPKGKGGEIQLTDALKEIAVQQLDGGVYGVIFKGLRYDTGDKVDYIKAIMQIAASREDIGAEISSWIKEFAKDL